MLSEFDKLLSGSQSPRSFSSHRLFNAEIADIFVHPKLQDALFKKLTEKFDNNLWAEQPRYLCEIGCRNGAQFPDSS